LNKDQSLRPAHSSRRLRADGDEDIGSQTGASLAILPFGPDQRSKDKGGHETDQRVEKVVKLKRLDEPHYLLDQGSGGARTDPGRADLAAKVAALLWAANISHGIDA
jgi:hypothetical protein